MLGVLIGFAIIGTIILIGYIVGRTGVLGDHGRFVISRIVFFVLSPCLLFTVLADADVHVLFTSLLLVSAIAAAVTAVVFALIARLVWRRRLSETVIGSLAASYVNANNIGLPVAIYVLGDTAFAAPVLLLQLVVFTPIALALLDADSRGSFSWRRVLVQPFTNPIIVASLLGLLFSVFEFTPPDEVMEPFRVIGAAAIPLVLLSFGMSLHGQRPLAPGSGRRDVLVASALKVAVMPLIAWLLGRFAFGLEGELLFAVVVLAALPSAQNVFNYAQRYERGEVIARDAVLISTILSVPVLVLIAALLAP